MVPLGTGQKSSWDTQPATAPLLGFLAADEPHRRRHHHHPVAHPVGFTEVYICVIAVTGDVGPAPPNMHVAMGLPLGSAAGQAFPGQLGHLQATRRRSGDGQAGTLCSSNRR